MATQWSLVIFTFFVCATSGLLAGISLLALRGTGKKAYQPAVIASFVMLVIGGIGAFTHLKHWERIFNGFGHITSGITQELIGCVALVIIMVLWFAALRGEKKSVGAGLAWATIIVAVGMVFATGHSYLMEGRPGWNAGMMIFYFANAALIGGVCTWALCALCAADDEAAVRYGIRYTFWGAIAQLAASFVYLMFCAGTHIADVGQYADPTRITTNPHYGADLVQIATVGDGALVFWTSVASVGVAIACAHLATRKPENAKVLLILAVIVAIAASFMFRVLIYQLGYTTLLLY